MNQEIFRNTVFVLKDKFFRFARRFLLSEDDAEDTVQEVMAKLWQMRGKLPENVETYAMKMVKNECLNKLKHNKVERDFAENYQGNLFYHLPDDNLREIIVKMIDQLPEKQRITIQLKDVEEYDYTEISEILEMEENAVRINLMRARQKIRTQLENLFEYENRRFRTN